MDEQNKDLVIPIMGEELHADAVPVITGGVRVTKRVESHDEIIQQELRKSHVEVKRVKTNRVVDGPQPTHRVGKTLIIPVVSEVLRVEKQWVVTEEIHITEQEQRETVQNKVTLSHEQAEVERVDASGNVVSTVRNVIEAPEVQATAASTILRRNSAPETVADEVDSAERRSRPGSKRKVLSNPTSILKDRD